MVIERQQERMRIKCSTLFSLQEDSEQDNGRFSDLVHRKSVILSVKIVHKVNGTKWLN